MRRRNLPETRHCSNGARPVRLLEPSCTWAGHQWFGPGLGDGWWECLRCHVLHDPLTGNYMRAARFLREAP